MQNGSGLVSDCETSRCQDKPVASDLVSKIHTRRPHCCKLVMLRKLRRLEALFETRRRHLLRPFPNISSTSSKISNTRLTNDMVIEILVWRFLGIILKGKQGNQNKFTSPTDPTVSYQKHGKHSTFQLWQLFALAFLSGSVRAGKRLGFTMKSPLLNRKLQNMCKETSLGKIPWDDYLSPSFVVATILDPKKRPDLGVWNWNETRSTWHSYWLSPNMPWFSESLYGISRHILNGILSWS